MAISSKKINLVTPIDEYGAELFISRKTEESLADYEIRVLAARKNLYNSGPEAFYKSLDYITTENTVEICEITFMEPADLLECKVAVLDEKIVISLDGQVEEFKFSEFKFLGTLIDEIGASFLSIQITGFKDSDRFKKSSHLIKTTSERKYLNFKTNAQEVIFPVQNVINAYDQKDLKLLPLNETGDGLDNSTREFLTLTLDYVALPLKLSWSIFKVVECKSEYFKGNLKDKHGTLTSEGATLINKILSKQNTYWGS